MKLMFFKSVLIVFFGMFLILSSCAKKSSSTQNRTGAVPRGDGAVTTTTLGVTKCADGSYVAGRIVDGSVADSGAFRNSWADFFTAIMSPDQLGELSGVSTSTTTGVSVELRMKVVNNQLSISETKLVMSVKDSFVGQTNEDTKELINEIKINFSSAKTGTLSGMQNGTGNFNLVFEDGYGTVTVTGTYNATTATGTVTFANSKHYDGASAAKTGTLGKFTLNSCGLFH
jgi:hypothetical protein